MNKRVLRKKVLSTLLTMSCVYLGGTSVLPMAEASMVDGNTVHGVVKSYSDNSTLNRSEYRYLCRIRRND